MENSKSLVTQDPKQVRKMLDSIKTVKDIVAKGATDNELSYFAQFCVSSGLNPVLNQIHFIKRANRPTFQVGIDGLRLIAERSGKYTGQTCVEFGAMITKTLHYRDYKRQKVAVEKEVPKSATIGICRRDFEKTLYVTVYWDEFCPAYPNQTMWIKMPRNQLEKVAEAKGLRKAFPNDLANVYTHDEMEQTEGVEIKAENGEKVKVKMNEKVKDVQEQKKEVSNNIYDGYIEMINEADTRFKLEQVQKKFERGLENNLISQEQFDQLNEIVKDKIKQLN